MVFMDDDVVVGTVVVTLYGDGSTGLQLSPPYGSMETADILRRAANALAGSAELAEADRLPVVCTVCAETATGVLADPSGATLLLRDSSRVDEPALPRCRWVRLE